MKKKFLWYQIVEVENKKYLKAFRYWTAQGMLYAHNTERIFKIFCEIFFYLIASELLRHFSRIEGLSLILISLFISHNINFILNCAVWETLICDLGLRGSGKAKLMNYTKELRTRSATYNSISCAFSYGSPARGKLHDSSDLDIVFIRKPGLINAISSLYIITREKVYSLFKRIPLEIFLSDDLTFIDRPMTSEKIIIIDDKSKLLKACEKETQTIEDAELLNGLINKPYHHKQQT